MLTAWVLGLLAIGVPKGNPVDSLYPGEYRWTTSMVNWTCVYNIKDYGGNDDDAFSAANKAAAGGGVVYFPSGTYSFTKNLEISDGVVIRGDGPSKTKLGCPDLGHMGFWSEGGSNVGVVDVELAGCAIMFWPELSGSGSTSWPAVLKSWYDATRVASLGKNILILNVNSHDVVFGNADPTDPTSNNWPWRFSTAIAAYASENILIAQNTISKHTISKTVSPTFSNSSGKFVFKNIDFPVDNRYGIDVNRILFGGVVGQSPCPNTNPTGDNLEPKCAPYFFPTGVSIRSNTVHNQGRVCLVFAGMGANVTDNVLTGTDDTVIYSVDGIHIAGGSDTNENRGIDIGGWNVNVTANKGQIYKQKTLDGYLTVDGSAILWQAVGNSPPKQYTISQNDFRHPPTAILPFGPIWLYKPSEPQDITITNNYADPKQFIGCVVGNGGTCKGPGNICKDNSPSCQGF